MLDKREVAAFLTGWLHPGMKSAAMTRKISTILDYAGIEAGPFLDVACGTGVLFPYYLARDVKQITGVDISRR